MTIDDLRRWSFENSLEDQWWVSLNGAVEVSVMELEELRELLSDFNYDEVKVLHASQTGLTPPPWVEVKRRKSVAEAVVGSEGGGKIQKVGGKESFVIWAILCVMCFAFYRCNIYEPPRKPVPVKSRYDKIRSAVNHYCYLEYGLGNYRLSRLILYEQVDDGYEVEARVFGKNVFGVEVGEDRYFYLSRNYKVLEAE